MKRFMRASRKHTVLKSRYRMTDKKKETEYAELDSDNRDIGLRMYGLLQTTKAEEFSGVISLYDNGTVKDSSKSPYCGRNQRISLSSYEFGIKKCNSEERRCQYQKKPLSSEAELILHNGCSFKQECDSLNFSTLAEQQNNILDSVVIGYDCLGDEDNLFDMCGDPAETLAGTVHLIIGNATRQYSSCQCLLKGENNSMVSVTLKDLRLCSVDKSQRKCSSSILKKDENTFVCNETSSAFGSVFNKELPRKVHNESITVSLEVKEPIFDMVWLIVETQGSMSVKCKGNPRENLSIGTTSSTEYVPSSNMSMKSEGSLKDDRTAQAQTALIAVCTVLIVMSIFIVTIVYYRKRWSRSKVPKHGRHENIPVADSAEPSSCSKRDNRPETFKTENAELGNQQYKDNADIAENEKSQRIRRQVACCLWFLHPSKSFDSRRNPQLERAADLEKVLMAHEGRTRARVDIHYVGSSCDSPVNDESHCQDEICYGKENDGVPVQETGQAERDDFVEKHHPYALLNHSTSTDSGVVISENEIYNTTTFKKPAPQRDPTYNRLPAERRSATYDSARNKFLTSQF